MWGGSPGPESSIHSSRIRIIGFSRGRGQIWAKHRGLGCLAMQEKYRSSHYDLDWSPPLSSRGGKQAGSAGVSTKDHAGVRFERRFMGINFSRTNLSKMLLTKLTKKILKHVYIFCFSNSVQPVLKWVHPFVEDGSFTGISIKRSPGV